MFLGQILLPYRQKTERMENSKRVPTSPILKLPWGYRVHSWKSNPESIARILVGSACLSFAKVDLVG